MKQKGFNYAVQEIKEDIINILNKGKLPLTVLEMILSGLLFEMRQQLDVVVKQEREEYEKKEEIISEKKGK